MAAFMIPYWYVSFQTEGIVYGISNHWLINLLNITRARPYRVSLYLCICLIMYIITISQKVSLIDYF